MARTDTGEAKGRQMAFVEASAQLRFRREDTGATYSHRLHTTYLFAEKRNELVLQNITTKHLQLQIKAEEKSLFIEFKYFMHCIKRDFLYHSPDKNR